MDRTRDEPSHAAVVDAWIARSLHGSASADVLELFRAAFEGLWYRAATTLGSATLIAIAERVLATVAANHPFLLAISSRPNTDSRWKQQLHDRLSAVPVPELIAGLRFTLIELLTILGRLTAEILTLELHAAVTESVAGEPEAKLPAGPHALRSVGGERE
jgi:hypothetical protein